MTVLVLASLAALAMVVVLRADISYAFRSSSPADLGDLRTASDATLSSFENRYVRADGLLGSDGAIRYERPFVDGTFRTMPIAGRRDLWVDVRVPAGVESGRWEFPRAFAGRLVRLGKVGPKHRGLAQAIEEVNRDRARAGSWLLIDGERPESSRWSAVLAALFLGFAGWNIAAVARMVRRLR